MVRPIIVLLVLASGCKSFPREIAAGTAPGQLVVAQGRLYWTDQTEGRIRVASLADGSTSVLVDEQHRPRGVVVSAGFLFWTNVTSGQVMKKPLLGGPSSEVASGQDEPSALLVDAGYLYWANLGRYEKERGYADSGSIARVPIDGGDVEIIASAQQEPIALAAAPEGIYWTVRGPWTDPNGGSVRMWDRESGQVSLIADMQPTPLGIAAGDNAVYWSNGGGQDSAGKPISAGSVFRHLDGKSSPLATEVLGSRPFALLLTQTELVWTREEPGGAGALVRANPSTGEVKRVEPTTGVPISLAQDGDYFYVAQRGRRPDEAVISRIAK